MSGTIGDFSRAFYPFLHEDEAKPQEELMAELRKLRGIGPYGAAHMAMLLGSYGHVPVDSWARELVRRTFTGGAPVTDRDVHRYFDQYGRWKALAFRCWDWDGNLSGR